MTTCGSVVECLVNACSLAVVLPINICRHASTLASSPSGSAASASIPYRRTGNLRAVQLLLVHTKIESTVRYLGVEIDDALDIAEKIEA